MVLLSREDGNVLFLILVAAALFAALSYAVTNSSKSGEGGAREKGDLNVAAVSQYVVSVRRAVTELVIGGLPVSELRFNSPENFAAVSDDKLVFHPDGGRAIYQTVPSDSMAGNSEGEWFFNANFDVPEIGMSGVGGNDLIAFLPGVSQDFCVQANKNSFVETAGCTMTDGQVPDLDTSLNEADIRELMDESYTFPTGDTDDLQAEGCSAFVGKVSGCFYESGTNNEYVYYSVILER